MTVTSDPRHKDGRIPFPPPIGFDRRSPDAHVAEPGGVDGSRLYGRALVRLRDTVTQLRVEVRHPLEVAFYEVAFEFGPYLPGVVQAFFASPPGEVRLRVVSVVVALSFAPTRPFPAAAP